MTQLIQDEQDYATENTEKTRKFLKSRTPFIYRNTGFRDETEIAGVDRPQCISCCVEVLRSGSCRVRSIYLTILLLGRLSPLLSG